MWPGIRDLGYFQGREGLTHKSPNVETDANGDPLRLRMLLKVDLDSYDACAIKHLGVFIFY